jgi:hypothetical protein
MGRASSGAFIHDLEQDALPAFSFVTPDLCHDGHGHLGLRSFCLPRAEVGDRWLRKWVRLIATSPAYEGSHTVLFITWDEGKVPLSSQLAEASGLGHSDRGKLCALGTRAKRCHVAMVVVSPSTTPCTTSGEPFNHYSLLKTTEELLGLPFIAHARDPATRSMSRAFNLVPGIHALETRAACVTPRTGTSRG